ncbi:hypothetical protein TrLO_g3087 [Triparma laevis f. longispina]|uniref:Uncharacterized protein n=1 Tax=Triparma laevis f. longispina TaxID=1714387 RepID=A0A9W7CB44_9STRA|nr:hypothetical protein TrLO_g3087 [Triparma laevis f. longispina]
MSVPANRSLFRIRLQNLPKRIGKSDLADLIPQLLTHLSLPPSYLHAVKCPQAKGFAVITFISESAKVKFLEEFNGHEELKGTIDFGALMKEKVFRSGQTKATDQADNDASTEGKKNNKDKDKNKGKDKDKETNSEGNKRGRDDAWEGQVTTLEIMNKLTPLHEAYLSPQKTGESFAKYKKTVASKACLVKITKACRKVYIAKIEAWNGMVKRKFQKKKNQMTEEENVAAIKEFGECGEIPKWLEKDNRCVEFCKSGGGKVLTDERFVFYRNKCEFNVGVGMVDDSKKLKIEGAEIEKVERPLKVGFMVRGWDGPTCDPDACYNVPTIMTEIAADLETNILTASTSYDPISYTGFYRMITVRVGREVDGVRRVMVIVQHTKAEGGVKGDGRDFTGIMEEDKQKMVKVWKNKIWDVDGTRRCEDVMKLGLLKDVKEGGKYEITDLVYQEFNRVSNPDPNHPVQIVYGNKFVTDDILNCKFEVSIGAFFQVNTSCANTLYQQAIDEVKAVKEEGKKLVAFDVCCGTGSIGICLLKNGACDRVVGCDISIPAIEDANRNKVLNGLDEDCGFVAGKAEDVLRDQIREEQAKNAKDGKGVKYVAVVDPAREGLHNDVLKNLRQNNRINTIVYISCNPEKSLINDAAFLCGPKSKKNPQNPFVIKSVQGVDMFPLTSHLEIVCVFERTKT